MTNPLLPKKVKKPRKPVQPTTSLRFPPEMLAWLQEKAELTETSVNTVVKTAIEYYRAEVERADRLEAAEKKRKKE